jgi:signal transduction histidine kinase/CheY-like chemotaxis protein
MKRKCGLTSSLAATNAVLGIVAYSLILYMIALGPASLESSSLMSPRLVLGLVIATSSISSVMLSIFIMKREVLKPIRNLASVMKTISTTNNLSLRVPGKYSGDVGKLVKAINELLDTTEAAYLDMLKARFEVENANKGKSLFIAKVSHELRTPIHGITGMLRILLKQETAPGKRQYIQMAQDSATSLLETINEILDFSKMQNGELSLESAGFSLRQTIRSTIEHIVPRFDEKPRLALCWDIQPDVPDQVIGDATRVRNILVNLLGNSFKFSEKGYVKLDVSSYTLTEGSGTGVRFSVSDTGIGISTGNLSTIFDPFTTADEGTARLYAGTGLGLAIVKQIAAQMGGSVSVESTLGVGSKFSVDVPLKIDNSSIQVDLYNSKHRAVAIVGSPGVYQESIASGLTRYGCHVDSFSIDDPSSFEKLGQSNARFDIVHIIKCADMLFDELAPLMRVAARDDRTVILSVPSSEIASTDRLARGDRFFVTLKPTSALDLLLIADGKLVPSSAAPETDEATDKATRRLNILIADDAKTNRIILKTLLEEAGHSVDVVENGQQLLERISFKPELMADQRRPYDLVLTDIQMPVMDGITAAQNFREIERKANSNHKLPIVAVTSYAFPEECSKMLASGIDHILTKPINPKRLTRLLSQISYDTDCSSDADAREQSDSDIISELCQLTENLALGVGELNSELAKIMPSEATTSIVDIEGVFERSGDSLKRTGLILSGFMESFKEPLSYLEEAKLPVSDPQTFRRHAHSLKGLLLDVGAQTAANMAAELESKAIDAPDTITSEEITKLGCATREAATIINELLGALPSLEVFSALPALDEALSIH